MPDAEQPRGHGQNTDGSRAGGGAAGADAIVVGSGVIGLTTAIALQESGVRVRIWSAAPPEDTTSAVAGATWFPYRTSPADRVLRWTAASKTYFDAMSGDPGLTGVHIRESLQLWREELDPDGPWWASAVPDLAHCAESELPDGFRGGYTFTQPVVTMEVYLRFLARRFADGGGTVTRRTVDSLDEPAAEADAVIDCTGLAARELAGDEDLVPVRGQVVRVENPGISRVIADFGHPDGEAYIIPHEDSCVLGGTAEEGVWDTEPEPSAADGIVARCTGLDSRLAGARVLDRRAGLRPVRTSGVRLEAEPERAAAGGGTGGGALIVHNYGHGGSGVTLSWGCAEEVTALVHSGLGRGSLEEDGTEPGGPDGPEAPEEPRESAGA